MSQRVGIAAVALLLCGGPGFAGAIYNRAGALSADDNMVLFTYVVQSSSQVNIFTTSYVAGGFSPVITIFDSTGLFQFEDQGISREASASWVSNAGEHYLVVLTEYDNVSYGPLSYYSDGFTEQGQGNFTAKPPFNPPLSGGFYEPGGAQRTGNWAITFSSADDTLAVTNSSVSTPEPASGALLLAGAAVFFLSKRLRP